MLDALRRALVENGIRVGVRYPDDIREYTGFSFLADLNRVIEQNDPYTGLYETSALVPQYLSYYKKMPDELVARINSSYERILQERNTKRFGKYDMIIFTETNDVLGHEDKRGDLKSALEILIFNPALQRAVAHRR